MKIKTNISHIECTDMTGILLNEMDRASMASFSCRIDAIRLVANVEDRTARDVTASDCLRILRVNGVAITSASVVAKYAANS
jgi:hypothetical protein